MGGDAYFLACGMPVIPSLGLCDAMRIGADVSAEWENGRDSSLLYNMAIPGTKNAIRTTVNRLWLSKLVQPDPDVAYFRSRECSLTAEQKTMLQALALVCGFKATSDLPQCLTAAERQNLRAFLEGRPDVKQISPCVFQLDERVMDFGPALTLPEIPEGLNAIQSSLMGWLANHGWALKINDKLEKGALEKLKKTL